jgi:mono/diheme cytochrome c family protein
MRKSANILIGKSWRKALKPLVSTRVVLAVVIATGMTSFAAVVPARADDKVDVERGHAIARKYCSPCHAVEAKQHKSPVADAPPFSTFATKWPLEDIEEALAEGIMVGHEGIQMPVFQLEPPEIEDFIAYLRTIQEPASQAKPAQ